MEVCKVNVFNYCYNTCHCITFIQDSCIIIHFTFVITYMYQLKKTNFMVKLQVLECEVG